MSRWTRHEICEFVRGKELYARDPQAANAPVPDWLVEASNGFGPNDSTEGAMESTHPEDRNILIGTFIEALGKPDEVITGVIRANKEGDTWLQVEIQWLNLVDHPDVGALLCTLNQHEAVEVSAPVITETGDHETTKWMVFDLDTSGVIRSVDGKMRETLGYQPEEMVGRLVTEFIHHDAVADAVANWVELNHTVGYTSTSRRPWVIKGGGTIWLEASYLNRGDNSIMAVVWDITEKRKQEQELADLTAQFQILADEVPAAVFRCDLDGTVLFHNARWSQLVEDRDGAGRLHDLIAEDDVGLLTDTLAALASEREGERRSIDVRSRDGAAVWRVSLRPTGDFGVGRVTVVGSIADVTATVRLQTEVRHDSLTGVLNRHGVLERLDQLLAQGPGSTLVAFVDLDGFKDVNDEHGHAAGDHVLVEVARRLTGALRPGDAVGRFGGDEFVVMCPDVRPGAEAGIIARIEAALSGVVTFEGGEWEAAASVGTARSQPGDDITAVLRQADHAMFEAKRARKQARGAAARR